ncbi:RNA-binding protein Nova [Marchantia polymorpha subsp. ruderalis]|uniref:K Homology domain-containing protein n=2 Tax=Marchantia polymorpha TaxID=3197 RepID=A0AAF6BQ01_MARPO|nr:hypothetical protein MARPO_0060s0047 [Marchantia polymorpha]BBN14085.1 hypothetical protein Mp_6g08740 [Marchantia polymorpha subsp. ruderalis]|eukprot:PTQ36960.1 hypothetical protein MARPO_0060s0047 [Marchantia polymorpha]
MHWDSPGGDDLLQRPAMESMQQQQQSPADAHTSSPNRPVHAETDNMSSITSSIRFLISNAAAGSVIGKGGATISEFQAQSNARIQLSRNHEYFPGTTDRIILISGTVSEILTALHLILSKILNEAEDENEGDQKSNQVRLIVPNNVCGAIIGKGGSTIKAFVEDSGANIKLSSHDQTIPGVSDRMVTITGTLEKQLRAVDSIISKLSEDPNYAQYANAPISYPGMGLLGIQGLRGRYAGSPVQSPGYTAVPFASGGSANARSKGLMPPLVGLRSPVQITLPVVEAGPLTTSLTVAVPDDRIGAIVGRAGKTIAEIQMASGVKIKISERGDFVAGTKSRKVTIAGTAEGVRIAQHLLTQKVQQSFASEYDR